MSIDPLFAHARQLIEFCAQATPQIQTAEKVESVVQLHQQMKQLYETFIKNYDIQWSRVSQIEDDSCATLTQIHDEVEKTVHAFEDHLLTRFPQARIDYGSHLVGTLESTSKLHMSVELHEQFPHYRKVRGDGNCFYTSFTVNYLQWLCQHPNHFELAIKQMCDLPDFPAKEEAIHLLIRLQDDPNTFEQCIQSDANLLIFISFLRQCAAHDMKTIHREWADCYAPETSQDPTTADDYIKNHVLKMGCDAMHYEINAICNLLNCQLWIVDHRNGLLKYHESSGPLIGGVYHEPGHYACLQQKGTKNLAPQSSVLARTAQLASPALELLAPIQEYFNIFY